MGESSSKVVAQRFHPSAGNMLLFRIIIEFAKRKEKIT